MNDKLTKFTDVIGGDLFVNLTDEFQTLRTPSIDELHGLLAEFRRRQWQWVQSVMLNPARPDDRYIFGLSATLMRRPKNSRVKDDSWRSLGTHVISIDAVPHAAWKAVEDIPPLANSSPSTRLANASHERQREFMRLAMGGSLLETEAILRPTYKSVFIYSSFEEELAHCNDPDAFLQALIAKSEFERRPLVDEERKSDFLRTVLVDLLLLWLAQNDILLFPIRGRPYLTDTRGFDLLLMSEQQCSTWKIIETAYTETRAKQPGDRRWSAGVWLCFQHITMISTLRTPSNICPEAFSAIFDLLDRTVSRTQADILNRVYRPLRDSLGRKEVPQFRSRRSNAPETTGPLGWTALSTSTTPRSYFPKDLPGTYDGDQCLVSWANRFHRLVPRLEIKSVGSAIAAYNRFLLWLLETGRRPPSLAELGRRDFNDDRPLLTSDSFRAYLHRCKMKPESANAMLQRLGWAFELIIDEDELPIANPINVKLDVFKLPTSRGKTPRRPLGRDLILYLRELNARDDFALSRSIASHYRHLLDPTTGQYSDRWFPAFAILIDLMLWLPLRGFQARFLDSGEGDDFVIDPRDPDLTERRNTMASAVRKRRESVFYAFETAEGDKALGIHVNTNKTAVDRESGYEIPWCSAELRNNLGRMLHWQIDHNPSALPIPCMEKSDFQAHRNLDIVETVKKTYAIFRDPDDEDAWPISREKLFEYWSRLLACAEDELATKGKKVSLTVEKEVSKGPTKARVLRRLAAFDIHTLRVSGISAMIEAGLPPDMVQDVAGHATIVMTLYYNKIKSAKLNSTLASALDEMSMKLDGIDGFMEADFDRLSDFLLNTRDPQDAAGKALLAERMGKGDGSVDVMPHGICPGGECETGGEFTNQAVGYGPVPRPLACSVCRYRLTGPMFLPGLVMNANRLMHELRRKGKEIAHLQAEREALEDAGKSSHRIKANIEALYRETDIVATEWAAEVQYVHFAEANFDSFLGDDVSGDPTALVVGLEGPALAAKIHQGSEFSLLQSLAEGAAIWPGFRPSVALEDHREFLNEILLANDVEPFLLRLRGDIRDRAAVLLGRTIAKFVPDENIDAMRDGVVRIDEFPAVSNLIAKLKDQAFSGNMIPGRDLLTMNESELEPA
ncbi:VPA1269 family protein [Rhizobium leguminosarum]|uniref:VPA1269 family protein n=1 Tax=Rhizobium leguminosarum TaxID=384 RepID=UPI00161D0627|nr:VPA1269 family protein [Rhizobium leguminosarum]MBB4510620.1 integrase [Rhizobium leguminosarum]